MMRNPEFEVAGKFVLKYSIGTPLGTWRLDPSVTHGFSWSRGSAWARTHLESLPDSAAQAIATMLDDLAIEPAGHEAYVTALLASMNGCPSTRSSCLCGALAA